MRTGGGLRAAAAGPAAGCAGAQGAAAARRGRDGHLPERRPALRTPGGCADNALPTQPPPRYRAPAQPCARRQRPARLRGAEQALRTPALFLPDLGRAGLRAARATVFAVVCVLLSAGARLVVTGEPLPVDVVLLAFGATLGVALLLSGAERGYRSIAAVLVPLQFASNAVFNAGQQSCPPGHSGGAGASSWDLLACGGGSIRPSLLGPVPAAQHALASLTSGQLLVLLGIHLLLALAAAWWLRRGEAWLFTLLRAATFVTWSGVQALLAVLLAPVPLPDPLRLSLPPADQCPLRPQNILPGAVLRRGPPASAQVC